MFPPVWTQVLLSESKVRSRGHLQETAWGPGTSHSSVIMTIILRQTCHDATDLARGGTGGCSGR